jgi:hypothetical protein
MPATALARLDRLRHAKGGTPTAASCALEDAEDHAERRAVFRTGESLKEGCAHRRRSGAASTTSRSPTAR